MAANIPHSLNLVVVLRKAIAHHKAGRLEQAEELYRAILQTQPYHPDANHNLGVIAAQLGKHAAGLPYLKAALAVNPNHEQYLLSYAEASLATGEVEEALKVLDAARQLGMNRPAFQTLRNRAETTVLGSTPAGVLPTPAENNQLVALFNAGHHAAAETRARSLIDKYPDAGFAWKVLGTSLQVQGKDALAALQRTAELLPQDSATHYNLGNAWRDRGQLDKAVASYRRALEFNPDFADAQINLGNALKDLGQLDNATASYRRALEIAPEDALAHYNLGIVLQAQVQFDRAAESYRRALEIEPDYVVAHYNLGIALDALGQSDGAVASYRRALEIKPDYAEARLNLGNCLRNLGRLDEAVSSYRLALRTKPDYAEAYSNLSVALHALGQFDDAVASCMRALEINPEYADAYNNLSIALLDLGQIGGAIASCRRALEIKPDLAQAHVNLGNCLREVGQLEDATASYRRALEINAESAEAHNNLGSTLQALGQFEEAVASCRRALELKPDYAEAHNNLLFCLSHSEAVDAQALFAEHCRYGEQFEAPLRAEWPRHDNSRDPERCLRVGFVSGDLRNHAVASFIEPVLAHLSSYPQLSLHAYSNHAIEDAVSQRLRGYLRHWHRIVGLSDAALAQKIRADGIDILIDLSGHTGNHRLLTFARKPAPVQATWMGYPGTTGLRAMDYYFTDRFFLPHERFAGQFTEALVYLPASAPFMPAKEAPAVNALPALSNGSVTFGSFNRPTKISRSVIALWARLLRALPDARMLLGGMSEEGRYGTLIEWFGQEGIGQERLSFHPKCPMQDYLGLHHQVDINLDTFPYNGGTTTLHALWMGVPTLTVAGGTTAGRTGASILGHAGLETFIAHDAEEFAQKGVFWAGNLAPLSEIRAGLREQFAKSAMGQPALVAAGLERALRMMWQRWCDGVSPAALDASVTRDSD